MWPGNRGADPTLPPQANCWSPTSTLPSRSWTTPTRSAPTRPSPAPGSCRQSTCVRRRGWAPRVGGGGPIAWVGPRPATPQPCRARVRWGTRLGPRDPAWPCTQAQACLRLLTLVAPQCTVPQEPFLLSCQADMAACAEPGRPNCSCATLSEYSRQCSVAGQPVSSWRGPDLCCESRGARREDQGGWRGGQAGGRRPLSQGSSTCSCGPVPGQPGVPGVRRDLRADLLQPAAQLLQLLHLRLLLPGR